MLPIQKINFGQFLGFFLEFRTFLKINFGQFFLFLKKIFRHLSNFFLVLSLHCLPDGCYYTFLIISWQYFAANNLQFPKTVLTCIFLFQTNYSQKYPKWDKFYHFLQIRTCPRTLWHTCQIRTLFLNVWIRTHLATLYTREMGEINKSLQI